MMTRVSEIEKKKYPDKTANERIAEIMKQTSEIARKNGLTAEILEQLMKDEK